MANLDHILSHAKQICESKGVKLTPKREKILRVLLAAQTPLSAYEIIDLCQVQFDLRISPISLYRMLGVLESISLIHRLKSANKYMICIHITCDHEHNYPQFLICHQCGQVKEFDVPTDILNALKLSAQEAGFWADNMQLELDCLCLECSGK